MSHNACAYHYTVAIAFLQQFNHQNELLISDATPTIHSDAIGSMRIFCVYLFDALI